MPVLPGTCENAVGEVGRSAPSHYSNMGYTVRAEALLQQTVRRIIGQLREEHVDAVVLTISISMMPELTASVGVPRIAAVEHPFGVTLGLPGAAVCQLGVGHGA